MNKRGFTLTEMMIVVIIISGLMMLIVPNLSQTKASVDNQTCEAFINLVDSQIQAYYLENKQYPADLSVLVNAHYLKGSTCPDGTEITIVNNQAVKVNETTTTQ